MISMASNVGFVQIPITGINFVSFFFCLKICFHTLWAIVECVYLLICRLVMSLL